MQVVTAARRGRAVGGGICRRLRTGPRASTGLSRSRESGSWRDRYWCVWPRHPPQSPDHRAQLGLAFSAQHHGLGDSGLVRQSQPHPLGRYVAPEARDQTGSSLVSINVQEPSASSSRPRSLVGSHCGGFRLQGPDNPTHTCRPPRFHRRPLRASAHAARGGPLIPDSRRRANSGSAPSRLTGRGLRGGQFAQRAAASNSAPTAAPPTAIKRSS